MVLIYYKDLRSELSNDHRVPPVDLASVPIDIACSVLAWLISLEMSDCCAWEKGAVSGRAPQASAACHAWVEAWLVRTLHLQLPLPMSASLTSQADAEAAAVLSG